MRKAFRGILAGLAIGMWLVCSLLALSMWYAGKIGGGAFTVVLALFVSGSIGAWLWMLGK